MAVQRNMEGPLTSNTGLRQDGSAVVGSRPLYWGLGVMFTFVVACIGLAMSKLPVFDRVGQLACAIILAVVYRQLFGYPEAIRSGIQFSSKRLLRTAIILYGLKLNVDVILHQGSWLLVRDTGTVVLSILLTVLIAKLLKADTSLSLLLGIGTGVCGAAAIAAVSPILRTKDEDTAIGAGIIALIGTVFAVGYTVLRPMLHLTASQYGTWCGVSLHELAHVALAGAPAGQSALAIALLAKLGRVLLLIPLSFLLVAWVKHRDKHEGAVSKVQFPWFLLGFIAMSLVGSYVLGTYIYLPGAVAGVIATVTTFALSMAMVGLGLNVSFRDLRTKAMRPLLAMMVTSLVLSAVTFFTL